MENSAKTYTGLKKGIGGAVFIWNCKGVTVSGCTFVKNSGEDKGGAIVVESMNYNRVSNCIFMNNTAKGGRGSAIYWDSSDYGNVSNCIFLNNGESVIFADCSLNANNNWFGNTATNYTNKPSPCDGVIMNMWLFLNATANPDSIEVLNRKHIQIRCISFKTY